MPDGDRITELYLTGLRNQHAVEGQAVSTINAELARTEAYPALHARMQQELGRSENQARRLDELLARHGTSASTAKEAVTTVVGKLSGLVHAPSGDDVVKNVLAAVGFKAYEIASYKTLETLAELAGASADASMLEQCRKEEEDMGDWLGEHLPDIVRQHAARATT